MTGSGQFGRLGRRCKTLVDACPGERDLKCSSQSPVLRCSRLRSSAQVLGDHHGEFRWFFNCPSPPTGHSARLLQQVIGAFRHSARAHQATILPAAVMVSSGIRQSYFTMFGSFHGVVRAQAWPLRGSSANVIVFTGGKRTKRPNCSNTECH